MSSTKLIGNPNPGARRTSTPNSGQSSGNWTPSQGNSNNDDGDHRSSPSGGSLYGERPPREGAAGESVANEQQQPAPEPEVADVEGQRPSSPGASSSSSAKPNSISMSLDGMMLNSRPRANKKTSQNNNGDEAAPEARAAAASKPSPRSGVAFTQQQAPATPVAGTKTAGRAASRAANKQQGAVTRAQPRPEAGGQQVPDDQDNGASLAKQNSDSNPSGASQSRSNQDQMLQFMEFMPEDNKQQQSVATSELDKQALEQEAAAAARGATSGMEQLANAILLNQQQQQEAQANAMQFQLDQTNNNNNVLDNGNNQLIFGSSPGLKVSDAEMSNLEAELNNNFQQRQSAPNSNSRPVSNNQLIDSSQSLMAPANEYNSNLLSMNPMNANNMMNEDMIMTFVDSPDGKERRLVMIGRDTLDSLQKIAKAAAARAPPALSTTTGAHLKRPEATQANPLVAPSSEESLSKFNSNWISGMIDNSPQEPRPSIGSSIGRQTQQFSSQTSQNPEPRRPSSALKISINNSQEPASVEIQQTSTLAPFPMGASSASSDLMEPTRDPTTTSSTPSSTTSTGTGSSSTINNSPHQDSGAGLILSRQEPAPTTTSPALTTNGSQLAPESRVGWLAPDQQAPTATTSSTNRTAAAATKSSSGGQKTRAQKQANANKINSNGKQNGNAHNKSHSNKQAEKNGNGNAQGKTKSPKPTSASSSSSQLRTQLNSTSTQNPINDTSNQIVNKKPQQNIINNDRTTANPSSGSSKGANKRPVNADDNQSSNSLHNQNQATKIKMSTAPDDNDSPRSANKTRVAAPEWPQSQLSANASPSSRRSTNNNNRNFEQSTNGQQLPTANQMGGQSRSKARPQSGDKPQQQPETPTTQAPSSTDSSNGRQMADPAITTTTPNNNNKPTPTTTIIPIGNTLINDNNGPSATAASAPSAPLRGHAFDQHLDELERGGSGFGNAMANNNNHNQNNNKKTLQTGNIFNNNNNDRSTISTATGVGSSQSWDSSSRPATNPISASINNNGLVMESNFMDTNQGAQQSADDQLDLRGSIPGEPAIDYPIYSSAPRTNFNCLEQTCSAGYYADMESQCQVFHVCQFDGRFDTFLCPNGTIFSQQHFVCVWWWQVECNQSSQFYKLNDAIYCNSPPASSTNSQASSSLAIGPSMDHTDNNNNNSNDISNNNNNNNKPTNESNQSLSPSTMGTQPIISNSNQQQQTGPSSEPKFEAMVNGLSWSSNQLMSPATRGRQQTDDSAPAQHKIELKSGRA